MGKHKRVKRTNRADPLARKTAQDEKIVNEKILPLLNQLKSPKPAERAVAIGAMNAMADDPKLRRMLMKEKAVQTILAHTLTDSSQEITSESYGFLRNVVLEEGRDAAMFLFRQNILASWVAAAQKLTAAWDVSMETLTGQDRATVLEFAENLLSLLSGLAMADDLVYDSIISNAANDALMLASKVLNTGAKASSDAAMEFLYVLTEDNPEVSVKLRELPLRQDTISSKVYYIGIQYNQAEITQTPLLDLLKELVQVLQSVDASSLQNVELGNISDPQELKETTIKMAAVRSEINAIQVCFELFGAITESLVGGDELGALQYARDTVIPMCLEVIDRTEFTYRVASALNNIGWTLYAASSESDSPETEWRAAAEQIWNKVVHLVGNEDVDIASAAVGAMGAVAQEYGDSINIESDVVQLIFSRCAALKTADTKDEYLQYLQPAIVLLAVVSVRTQNLELIGALTDLLLEIIMAGNEVQPSLLMEALDALIDLFADNEAPAQSIYVEKSVQQQLKQSLPAVKRSLKAINKSTARGLWEQGNEALMNISNFLEYKSEALQ